MGSMLIHNEDFLENKKYYDKVDLIVTSPPYNLNKEYDNHDDNTSWDEYYEFTKKWLKIAYKMLNDNGRMVVNIPLDTSYEGKHPFYHFFIEHCLKIGFKYNTTIIWNEGTISNRIAWGSFQSASAPNIITPVETILVFYKKNWVKGKGVNDITKEEFIQWTNGLWDFRGESAKRVGHPAPFPQELPKRVIKMYSFVGDIVLDPFLGSGTSGLVAKKLNRKFIGFELNKEFYLKAKKRIENEIN